MQSKATTGLPPAWASWEMAEEPQEGKSAGTTRARSACTELGWPAFIPFPGTKALSQLAGPETSQRLATPPGSVPLWLHMRSKKLPSPQPSVAPGRRWRPGLGTTAQRSRTGLGSGGRCRAAAEVCTHTCTHAQARRTRRPGLGHGHRLWEGPKRKGGAQGPAEGACPLRPGPRGPRRPSSHGGSCRGQPFEDYSKRFYL